MKATITQLVKKLALTKTEDNLFNPYNEYSKMTDDKNAPGLRQKNVRLYLNSHQELNTKIILLYLAPTYYEAKRSGVPLVSADQFKDTQDSLETEKKFEKATKIRIEANSTVFSSVLNEVSEELGINPLVWPVIPFYAHKPGDTSVRRKPSQGELLKYREFIDHIIEIYSPKTLLAIGKDTLAATDLLKIKADYIEHPRRGKSAFKKALKKFK